MFALLSDGLHARPASHLAEVANDFASECLLTNLRTGSVANLKSVLAIISTDVRQGDECTVQVRGSDEQAAHAALCRFVEQVLPGCDVPLAGLSLTSASSTLPRLLRAAEVKCCFGSPVSSGIGQGKGVLLGGVTLPKGLNESVVTDPQTESGQIKHAIAAVRGRIREKLTPPEIFDRDSGLAGGPGDRQRRILRSEVDRTRFTRQVGRPRSNGGWQILHGSPAAFGQGVYSRARLGR